MPKVKVIKRYNDLELKKIQDVGKTFETSEKRAQHLVEQGMVEIVAEPKKASEKKG